MRYFGGKQRVASELVEVIKQYRKNDNQLFFEPFLGGANIVTRMTGRRAAADANDKLISMYKAIQSGWIPPDSVSREEYDRAKTGALSDHITAFIGFGCSFAGKWFGGYASSGSRNYAINAKNSLLKKLPGLVGVNLLAKEYTEFDPTNCLIYCDPPYKGTTQYGAVGEFNSDVFWGIMRRWGLNNTVLVSEYTAPDFCECVWHKEVITDIRGKDGKIPRIEKLFLVK